ncbi:hypothetical protein M422DRAFT_30662 [Sphaerobolus stellatus SS14]|uniref:T-cell immunomodulatory protein TIP C2 domain-containing protein n=1 Tax=Sphaerobolus stellatus (strain SS14) TaxID=990650 RepID=A0A0C9VZY3_SPHS4|nr:hypothetical protein M422DRAFT_30662 [Sphaerobolus stellatus SS14]
MGSSFVQHSFLIFALASYTLAVWPFPPKRFTGNSLVEAGALGLDPKSRLVAFGDLNGDQFTDVITIDEDQRTITPYIWNHDSFMFEKSSSPFRHPNKISNIVPGDFNNDGRLDLLVMSQKGRDENVMAIYFSSVDGTFDSSLVTIQSSTDLQPMVLDSNGDMKIDLLGLVPSTGSGNPSLKIWRNVWNETSNSPPVFELIDPIFNYNDSPCKLSQPHSNAFLDFDGDCLADVFLTCEIADEPFFQIWLNSPEGEGYYLGFEGKLPRGSGRITFADMDRDGTIDMVFPSCTSVDGSTGVGKDCMINIAYNQQLPLCTSTTSLNDKKCRRPDALCVRDPDFRFDFTENSSNNAFSRIPVTSFGSESSLLMVDTTNDPPIPLPIRVGDLSLDGFPDLIPIITTPTSGGVFGIGAGINRTPAVLTSVPCARGIPGCSADGRGRRGFQHLTSGVEALQTIVDARSVAVLDLDEDGTLDILIQRTGEQQSGSTTFIHNNFFYDAFFLKAMVLNRPCDGGLCTLENGTRYQPFGISYPGASYKYTVQDTSGRRSAAQVPQLPQTSYHSLHTPYAFFGLGRTNNYIENLFVGSTKKDDTYINMEGVVPNSKLVIIPSPPGQTAGWKRELFLRPGAWIPWVTLTVIISTALLAVIVFVLHLNEKRADELERRRASHHINFDAL